MLRSLLGHGALRSTSTCLRVHTRIATDGTHHLNAAGEPLYPDRYRAVLPFHAPGLAPVQSRADGTWWHIKQENGVAAYSARYLRAFGFYEGLASVVGPQGFFHIGPTGDRAYQGGWSWSGNFQQGRCTVRSHNGYQHIDSTGIPRTKGPFAYAGDFREGFAVVVSLDDGLSRHVDGDGRLLTGVGHLELDVFHKGAARARDERGWFFVNSAGDDVCRGARFASVEPFYNGQALVTTLQGSRQVITEAGEIAVELPVAQRELAAQLQSLATAYWAPMALRLSLDAGLLPLAASGQLRRLPPLQTDASPAGVGAGLRVSLAEALCELGLLHFNVSSGGYDVTPKGGALLRAPEHAGADPAGVAGYWLQPRYLSAWMGSAQQVVAQLHKIRAGGAPDHFSSLQADGAAAVRRSRDVLAAYASKDWAGLAARISDLLTALPILTPCIVDVGGGSGALLRELATHASLSQARLICVDRHEVVASIVEHNSMCSTDSPGVEFVGADMFNDALPGGGHVYVLSRVLHDWDDVKGVALLRRVYDAAAPGAVLLCVDRVSTPAHTHALLSLHMQLLNCARERRLDEWAALFGASSWVPCDAARAPMEQLRPMVHHSGHAVFAFVKPSAACDAPTCERNWRAPASVAVIPIAGLGTRMHPQSSVVPKAFLPVLVPGGNNGTLTVRPALDLILSSVLAHGTGVAEAVVVASPSQQSMLSSFLSTHALRNRVRVVEQAEPRGFGHAVLCARDAVLHAGGCASTHVMVVLGDHVFTVDAQGVDDGTGTLGSAGCFRQLQQLCALLPPDAGLTAVGTCALREVGANGLLAFGQPSLPDSDTSAANAARSARSFVVSAMAEKPPPDARTQDCFALPQSACSPIDAGAPPSFLCNFGIDMLPMRTFGILSELGMATSSGSELGLRDAMAALQRSGRLHGVRMCGYQRHYIGNPAAYWAALQAIASRR